MAKYKVELKPSAQKELERLPNDLIERIVVKLDALEDNPRPHGCKKLKGVRVGDYRIVYIILDNQRLVSVTRIRHRNEVYD